jgi:hypothetical protein
MYKRKRAISEFGETFPRNPRIHLTKAGYYVKVDNIERRYALGTRGLGSSADGVAMELTIEY